MYPEAMTNDRRAGILEIRWPDGLLQRLGNGFLRGQCQCAGCRSAEQPLPAKPELRINSIVPVGSYAVQLIFSDGHVRGIFPWIYLRSLRDRDGVSAGAADRQ